MTLPDIDRALGRIEGHMENHRISLNLLQKNIRHLDTRLNKLEKVQHVWHGATTVVLCLGNVFGALSIAVIHFLEK